MRMPSTASEQQKHRAAAHACGLQATGYAVGPSPGRRENPQNSSGKPLHVDIHHRVEQAREDFQRQVGESASRQPAAMMALSCGQTDPS